MSNANQEARPPRRDQVRNRQHLVDAALHVWLDGKIDSNLGEIASRAGMATSSLFRHFATRDDLAEAVMDVLLEGVRRGSAEALALPDPVETLRYLLSRGCRMTDAETSAFAALAASSPRLNRYADLLIGKIVEPIALRLQTSGRLRPGLTVEDMTLFVRMLELTESDAQRDRAIEVFLAGIVGQA